MPLLVLLIDENFSMSTSMKRCFGVTAAHCLIWYTDSCVTTHSHTEVCDFFTMVMEILIGCRVY